jgi:hypothetical protein
MESQSSILADRSPVILRLQAVMSTLNNFVIANDSGGLSKFAFLMQALTDEVIEELEDKDEEVIGDYMERMGEVIAWIGHGDTERLPDMLKPFADQIDRPPVPVEA